MRSIIVFAVWMSACAEPATYTLRVPSPSSDGGVSSRDAGLSISDATFADGEKQDQPSPLDAGDARPPPPPSPPPSPPDASSSMRRIEVNVIYAYPQLTEADVEQVEAAFERVNELYGEAGIEMVPVAAAVIDPGALTRFQVTETQRAPVLASFTPSWQSGPLDPSRVSIYFLTAVYPQGGSSDVSGVATLGGPSPARGDGALVALGWLKQLYNGDYARIMGDTIAHEIGHYMGLPHTSEWTGGEHDRFADTPECTRSNDRNGDGQLSTEECPDGQNLMFWTGTFDSLSLSNQQIEVMRNSAIVTE